jgi:hypothetical protein
MTKRNKKYKPKYLPGTLPPIFGLSKERKTDLRLPYHISLDAIRMGQGTVDDAHTIVSALLVGAELAKLFQDAQKPIADAIDAIAAVKERGDKTGKWGVSGDQFQSISKALVMMDDMQDGARRREVMAAIRKVWREAA